jgi:hypothetical protein
VSSHCVSRPKDTTAAQSGKKKKTKTGAAFQGTEAGHSPINKKLQDTGRWRPSPPVSLSLSSNGKDKKLLQQRLRLDEGQRKMDDNGSALNDAQNRLR